GTIADKAGWSLTASGEHLARKVSVRIKNRPASEVLATVAEVAGLQTRMEGDALVVQDAVAATTAVPVAVPAAPQAKNDAEDDEEDSDDVVEKVKEKVKHRDREANG